MVLVVTISCTVTCVQVFARLGGREPLGDIDLPFLSPLNSGHGVKGGDTIEVWGEEGSGKSELLLNIATQCAIPKHWKGVWLGGRGQQCILISTDYKVDLLRLEAIIEGQIRQRTATSIRSSSCQLLDDTKQLLTDTLNRIHVLYCSSSHQLTATLHYLREFTHNNPELSVILLDNVGAFYWSDRADTFRHNSDTPATGAKHNNWIRTLQELVKDRHLVLFAARPVLFTRRPDQVLYN